MVIMLVKKPRRPISAPARRMAAGTVACAHSARVIGSPTTSWSVTSEVHTEVTMRNTISS